SWETPTSQPAAPSAATISVAAGSSDTTRITGWTPRRRDALGGAPRADAVQQEAEQGEDHESDDGRLSEAAQGVVQAHVIGQPVGAALGAGDRRDHDAADRSAGDQAAGEQDARPGLDVGEGAVVGARAPLDQPAHE